MVTIATYHQQAFQSLNELRQHLYARKKSIQALPPTDDAFQQHVLRALFQTCVWVKAMQTHPALPSPLDFGWLMLPSGVQPLLITMPSLPPSLQGNLFCSCKQMCARNCPCHKKQMPCAVACSCRGDIDRCVRMQLVQDDTD